MLNLLTLLLSQQPVVAVPAAPAPATPTPTEAQTSAVNPATAAAVIVPVTAIAAPESVPQPIAISPQTSVTQISGTQAADMQIVGPQTSPNQLSQQPLPFHPSPLAAPAPVQSPVVPSTTVAVTTTPAAQPSVTPAPIAPSPAVSPLPSPTAIENSRPAVPAGSAPGVASPAPAQASKHDVAMRRAVLESRLAKIVTPTVTPVQEEEDFAARKRDRQTVLESRLAEIVNRDRLAKTPQAQEKQINTALDYANQGQFDQARQTVQTIAVPAVRRQILHRIAALELTTTKPTSVQGSQARQIITLSKLQRPRIDPRVKVATAGPDWRNLPPKSERNFAVVNPVAGNPQNFAYNRMLSPNQLNNGDLQIVYPVPVAAPITSPFGWRVHPISGTRRFHSGTDIGAAQGTPVLAAYSGRVKGADYLGGYGLAITIEHKNGTLDTLYAHLSQISVRPGDWVEQGTMIGEVGSTGASTGPHLHFELRKLASDGWATLDPGPQLKIAREHLVKITTQARTDRPSNQS
jgi:murein DD-endopeptidase MepM/ murein hydrolase activator NlpD